MEALEAFGSSKVRRVTKVATRDAKPNDKRDGMIALGEGAEIPDNYAETPREFAFASRNGTSRGQSTWHQNAYRRARRLRHF